MNREIAILREVVLKLTPMLAGKGLRVTQYGAQAFVKTDMRTLKPVQVNIPFIPDDADRGFILAIQGFIDHEVGHILFTDWAAVKARGEHGEAVAREGKRKAMTPKKGAEQMRHLGNIVEDPFVERKMGEKFPGSKYNVDRLHDIFLERITAPAMRKVGDDKAAQMSVLMVPLIRAWSGQPKFDDFMSKNGYYDLDIIKGLKEAVSPALIAQMPKLKTSWEVLEVAKKLFAILFPEDPPPPPPPPPSDCKDKSKDKSEPKPGDEGDDGDEGEGEGDKGGKSDKSDPKDKKPEDKDDKSEKDKGDAEDDAGDGDDAEGDDAAGSESDDTVEDDREAEDETEGDEADGGGEAEEDAGDGEDAEGEPSDEEGDSSGEAADAEADAETGDDDDAEGDGKDDDAEEAEDSAEAGGDGDSGDDEDESEDADGAGDDDGSGDGSASDEGSADSDREAGAAPSEDTGDEGKEAEGGAGGETEGDDVDGEGEETGEADQPGKGPSPFEDVDVDMEGRDLGESIASILTDDATDAMKSADYRIFSRDWDRIEVIEVDDTHYQPSWLEMLDEQTRSMVAPMQKEIERMMAARSQVIKVPGFRSGRLHGASLHRLRVNDDRVFRRVQENKSKDTAVGLLIDNSGSMSGRKVRTAMAAGYALSQTLERVGIAHEVLGFTTLRRMPRDYLAALQAEIERIGTDFTRNEPLYLPIYKGFDERLVPEVRKRFAQTFGKADFLSENVDGECVRIAAGRLMARREARKVLIVLSDGSPACRTTYWSELSSDLKAAVKDCEKAKIETIGIGIMDASVSRYYPKHVVLDDLNDLPKTVMGELKRILMAK